MGRMKGDKKGRFVREEGRECEGGLLETPAPAAVGSACSLPFFGASSFFRSETRNEILTIGL